MECSLVVMELEAVGTKIKCSTSLDVCEFVCACVCACVCVSETGRLTLCVMVLDGYFKKPKWFFKHYMEDDSCRKM